MADRNSNLNKDEKELLEIQEEVKRLRPYVNKLKMEKEELEKEIPLLTEKKVKAQDEADIIISKANEEADKIKDKASTLYNKVKDDEKKAEEATDKASKDTIEAKGLMDKAEALLKSNEGREKNIEIAERDNKALRIKLENIGKRIKEMLEE
jgi:chromosome segregation ATPase